MMETNEPLRTPPLLRRRQRYEWPTEAQKLARQKPRIHPSNLVEQLHAMTGYPRDACWRFAGKFGIQRPTHYHQWSQQEQHKVLEMSETRPVSDIAKHFGVTTKAIYHVIAQNNRQVSRRSEWFGVHAVASYLTVKPARVRNWIGTGKLKCVVEEHQSLKYTMISGAELVRFCKAYRSELLRQRIPEKRILFLTDYVVAGDVADAYGARSNKLEREAFERGEYLGLHGDDPSTSMVSEEDDDEDDEDE